MTPFHFRLQRVLDFRRTQFQIAESQCHQVEARLRTVQAQHTALAARKTETRTAISRLPMVAGGTLAPLTDWLHWTITEDQRFAKLEKALDQELQKRRTALVEANRKVRLLEKLHEQRRVEWQAEFEREIDEIAADAVNSRYAKAVSLHRAEILAGPTISESEA
jgi:flagellar export protein FliJ